MSSVYTMDQITQYLVGEFARIFPDHESHAPLVRAAIQARSKRVQTIFDFYDEHKGITEATSLGEMCERSLRATIKEEVGKTSQKSGFVLRSFLVLNRAKAYEMLVALVQSAEVAALVARYPFTAPLLVEVSSPEWLSSRLGL